MTRASKTDYRNGRGLRCQRSSDEQCSYHPTGNACRAVFIMDDPGGIDDMASDMADPTREWNDDSCPDRTCGCRERAMTHVALMRRIAARGVPSQLSFQVRGRDTKSFPLVATTVVRATAAESGHLVDRDAAGSHDESTVVSNRRCQLAPTTWRGKRSEKKDAEARDRRCGYNQASLL